MKFLTAYLLSAEHLEEQIQEQEIVPAAVRRDGKLHQFQPGLIRSGMLSPRPGPRHAVSSQHKLTGSSMMAAPRRVFVAHGPPFSVHKHAGIPDLTQSEKNRNGRSTELLASAPLSHKVTRRDQPAKPAHHKATHIPVSSLGGKGKKE